MPKKSIGLLFTVTILATGLLVVLLAVLSYPEVAEAEITQAGLPGLSEKPGLDPRWLALITEEGARRSAQIMNGGPSINVDLTAQTVAGLSDSPLPVQITATRGVTILLDAIIQPTPIDQFYLYQVTVECEPWELDCFEFKADDIVWVEQGGSVVSMTLPLLTAESDAVADQVDGKAPPNDPVTVYLFPSMEPAAFLTATVAADGGGDYQVAWGPSYDVLPPDDGYSRYSAAVGKSAFVRYVTPLVRVENAGLEVAGIVIPDSEVEIEIRDAQGNRMFSTWTRANEFGTFFTLAEHYWGLYDQPSEFIRPGYQVHVEAGGQQISMTVAELSAQMDLSTQTVFGGGPPGATLGFVQMDGPLVNRNETLWHWNPSEFLTATVDSFGEFSVGTDLARGNYGAVIHRDAQGQQTFSRYTVPFMRARMGSAIPHWRFVDNLVDGQISGENQALTVTIQGPSGYLKDYFEVPAYFNGYFRHYQGEHQENITLDYGDVITVSTSEGPVLSMAMPNLTVEVDPNNYTVSGVAPAGAALKVFVVEEYIPDPPPYPPPFEAGNDYQPLEIELMASPDGNYLADFSSLGGFDPQSSGVVLMTFPDGNQVMRTFQVGAICPPRLESAQVGGNSVWFESGGFCANSVLRLKNASGDLKGEIQFYDSSYDANYEFWDGLQPILLLPGDTLEVENGGEVRSWEIPTLTLAADLEADLIYGEGTPGEVLAIYVDPFWSRGGYYGSYTTTVSHAGLYSLSVGADFSLFPGDQVHVNQEGDNPRFFAHYGIPIIRAVINDWEVNGVLAPYTLYTLAIQTAGQVYVMPENISFSEGWFFNYLFTEDGQELPVQPGDTLVITTTDQVIEFPIPWMSAIVDPTKAEINGEAPPNASLRVYVNSDNGWGTKTITATLAGTYQVEFPDLRPLFNATGGVIYNNEAGNETELRFATRHLNITLGDNCVFGTVGTPGSAYTLTFQTSDGGYEEVISGISPYYGGDISVCLSRVIAAGDHIILADPADEITVDIPHLSAQYDPIAQVIRGNAISDARLIFELWVADGFWGPLFRHTIAAPDGSYGIDVSDLELDPFYPGMLTVTDRRGNIFQMRFEQLGKNYFPMLYWRWGP